MRALRSFLVTLSAASLIVACQPGGDPASDDGGMGGTAGQGGMGGQGGEGGMGGEGGLSDMGGPSDMGDPRDTGMGGVGGEPDMGGMGGVGGDGGMGGDGGNVPPGFCPAEITYLGQIVAGFIEMPEVPNGGVARFEPYDAAYDAGIAQVLAAVPAGMDPVDLSAAPLAITEATVIATNYYTDMFDVPPNQSRFWVADANGAIELFLDFNAEGATPDFQIRSGHKISFNVTEVGRYFARGQITKATDFELVETDAPVYVNDTGGPFNIDQIHQLVRVTGILRNQEECGADTHCWDLMAPGVDGADGPRLGIYRSRSQFAVTGACTTYVGPLGWFQDDAQFDVVNFTWSRIYD